MKISTKMLTAAIFFVALTLPGVLSAQTVDLNDQLQATFDGLPGKWNFASAQVVEKNKKTGMVYAGKTFYSADEIEDKTYFSQAPVSMEFSGENGGLVNVIQKYGFIGNARVMRNDENMLLMIPFGDAMLSPEEILTADLEKLYVTAQYENVRVSDNMLSLQYTYIYMVDDKDMIDGVMTITFKREQK